MSVDLLVVGAGGQIGTCLCEQAQLLGVSFIGMFHEQLDICDEAKLSAQISNYKPKCIINAAAYTQVDKAESDQAVAYATNVQGVIHLAKSANAVGAILIHLSTDYVFDGLKAGAYLESDQTNPLSVYGSSKQAGELVIEEYCPRYLIVRTGWVFGEHGNNFVNTMLKLASKRTALNVVADQVGGPTYAGDIASTLLNMIQQAMTPQFCNWGAYHYAGIPHISWFEFASEIFSRAMQQGLLTQMPELKPIGSAEYVSAAKRPANSRLDCTKIKSVFNIPPCDWKAALADLSPYMPT
ncbi:dTDP-4-dehydrorhamnose reductase [Shewanella sp. 4t3-1-2LB]|uniref:dTDP-4-dehydrorhamnose reductase n=1 Tax=Shewanella sp. 4t3-1-2LB TaxID=2817682 RepID=UPI001A9982BF|nr:dTDP-4-dehydrorhamnose reductase [Shewanella sp. 4t3-1-2LB]MBO1273479.1 dTDP-4-dehydrorhamnose reductase [Shewanella sp. 4t3-1-2LB]